jgi:probable F420-dependent oxidoreductase
MPTDRLDLDPIGLWAAPLRTMSMSESQDAAAEIEELGYGAMWFPESNGRDVFVHIGLLLERTTRIVGGTAVATIWARDALAMACTGRTLTEAFPERFVLGLGVSHHLMVDDMRGGKYERPLSKMRAYLDGMDVATYTAPPPSTPVRRMISALGPKMLELAGARADGVLPYFVPPEHTAIARAALPSDSLLCPIQAVVIDDDRGRAREIARAAHTAFYMPFPNYTNNLRRLGLGDDDFTGGGSNRLVDMVTACGPVEIAIDRLRAHFDAGADHVGVQIISDDPAAPRRLWRELAPALRELAESRRRVAEKTANA